MIAVVAGIPAKVPPLLRNQRLFLRLITLSGNGMSLKHFVQRPSICALLKPLRPDMPRKLPVPMRVPPRTANPQILGSAFDYLFRFELQRRVKGIDTGPWVAESAKRHVSFTREEFESFASI